MSHMRRREFITMLGEDAVTAWPLGARAQEANAGDWLPQKRLARQRDRASDCVPTKLERSRLCRGPERHHQIPFSGGSQRPVTEAGVRAGSSARHRVIRHSRQFSYERKVFRLVPCPHNCRPDVAKRAKRHHELRHRFIVGRFVMMNKIIGAECHPDGFAFHSELLSCIARFVGMSRSMLN